MTASAPRPFLAHAVLAVAFAALMALSAQITVPMVPVPMTMQTFAVLLAGAVQGPRWGAVSVLIYLAAGAAGLPVFSDGAGGWQRLVGPTAGYLLAFPFAAGLAGWARDRGWLNQPLRGIGFLTALHLMILTTGAGWLSRTLGVEALEAGFMPFLLGAVVKSALTWATLRALERLFRLRATA